MRLAIVAMIGLSVGCGVEERIAAVPPDAYPGIDTYCGCNLVAQTGCLVGEKCTWFHDVKSCALDGTLPVGAACARSADGDDCAGGVCAAGICRAYCTLSPDSCAQTRPDPDAELDLADARPTSGSATPRRGGASPRATLPAP